MPKHGLIVWTELNTREPEPAMRFYEETVGWTFEPVPMADGGRYWVARMDDVVAAGLFTMTSLQDDAIPEHWFSYLEVDDVDSRSARVEALGGHVLRQPFTIPGVGRVAIVKAPGGAVMGWMTSAERP